MFPRSCFEGKFASSAIVIYVWESPSGGMPSCPTLQVASLKDLHGQNQRSQEIEDRVDDHQ